MPRADAEGIRAQFDRLPAGAGQPDSSFAMWAFVKDGAIQHLQHALKYGNRPLYGHALGQLLAPALAGHLEEFLGDRRVDAVVPVPLHPSRRLERGYNQSQYLAEGIATGLASPPLPLLRRGRRTRTQTTLGVDARWGNVAGAFEIAAPLPEGVSTVVLVDDVLTTGATASAAAEALRDAGVREVHLATLAFAAAG